MTSVLDHTMCKSFSNFGTIEMEPIERTNEFEAYIDNVGQYNKIGPLYSGGIFRWDWFKEGVYFHTSSSSLAEPPPGQYYLYAKPAVYWNYLDPGNYSVEVYWNESLMVTEYFVVISLAGNSELVDWYLT